MFFLQISGVLIFIFTRHHSGTIAFTTSFTVYPIMPYILENGMLGSISGFDLY